MAFISRLKILPQGTLRLLVCLSVALTMLLFTTAVAVESFELIVISFISFFVFWIVVRSILWIKDGYKQDAK